MGGAKDIWKKASGSNAVKQPQIQSSSDGKL